MLCEEERRKFVINEKKRNDEEFKKMSLNSDMNPVAKKEYLEEKKFTGKYGNINLQLQEMSCSGANA